MNIREQLEELEARNLSPFASLSRNTKGRDREEEPCDIRPAYQRDRDRILHCKSFRRLKHKTQVFLSPVGDHYRTRLTHTLEVAQIARTISKSLRLNEELTEAIALGHDLGHTPFGHAGEDALNSVCSEGFAHYKQSVRVVERLEKNGRGLNLTWEVRDGILNHRTAGTPHTLEGKVVRLSDKIAYINHDIDDAMRGGIIYPTDIPVAISQVLGFTHGERIERLVLDIVENSQEGMEIHQSPEVAKAMAELKNFMFEAVYFNPRAKGEESKAEDMICHMCEYYCKHHDNLPGEYQDILVREGVERAVTDYIAGMSDAYAVEKFEELFIPMRWMIK